MRVDEVVVNIRLALPDVAHLVVAGILGGGRLVRADEGVKAPGHVLHDPDARDPHLARN